MNSSPWARAAAVLCVSAVLISTLAGAAAQAAPGSPAYAPSANAVASSMLSPSGFAFAKEKWD